MIITWKNQEGTFNTQPLTRKIRLHWDNLRDGYYIAFDSQGGSYVDTIMGKYNSDIEKPEDPVFGVSDLLIHLSADQLEKRPQK